MRAFHPQIVAAFAWKGKSVYGVLSAQFSLCAHHVMKKCTTVCLFHDRDAYVNGYFHAIPPTVGVDEEDCTQIIGIYMLIVNVVDGALRNKSLCTVMW